MSKEIYICEYGNALMIMMKRLVLHGQIFNTLRVTILNALRKDNINYTELASRTSRGHGFLIQQSVKQKLQIMQRFFVK